jgi:hypothetical protein
MKTYSVLTFGSCSVNILFQPNVQNESMTSALRSIGVRPPFVLSLAEAVQGLRFFRGEKEIPVPLRWLCGLDRETDTSRSKAVLDAVDFIFLEPCGAIQLKFRDYDLTRFLVDSQLVRPLEAHGPEAMRATRVWYNQGVMQCNAEAMASAAEFLLPLVEGDDEEAELCRAILLESRPVRADEAMVLDQMSDFASLASAPIGVVTYTHQYMPDGRGTEWPPGFNNSVMAAAAALDLPWFEPSELVRRHGVPFAMKADRAHYSPEFEPIIAQALEEFMDNCLNRRQTRAERVAASTTP